MGRLRSPMLRPVSNSLPPAASGRRDSLISNYGLQASGSAPSTLPLTRSLGSRNSGGVFAPLPAAAAAHHSLHPHHPRRSRVWRALAHWWSRVEAILFNIMYAMCEENQAWQSRFITHVTAFLDFAVVFVFTMSTGSLSMKDMAVGWLAGAISWSAFVYMFHIIVVLIIVAFGICVAVGVMFEQEDIKAVWPIRVLRTLVVFFLTIGYIPLLRVVITPLICSPDARGRLVLATFPRESVFCWTGPILLHQAIALVAMIVFVPSCLLVSLLFFESRQTSPLPMARFTARTDLLYLCGKTLLIALEPLSLMGAGARTARIVIITLTFTLVEVALVVVSPYYHTVAHRIKSAVLSAVAFACLGAIVVDAVVPADAVFTVGIPIQVGMAAIGAAVGVGIVRLRIWRIVRNAAARYTVLGPTPLSPPHLTHGHSDGSSTTMRIKKWWSQTALAQFLVGIRAMHRAILPLERCALRADGTHTPSDVHRALGELQVGMADVPQSAWLAAQAANFVVAHRPPSAMADASTHIRRARAMRPSLDVRFLLFVVSKRLDQSITAGDVTSFDLVSRIEMQHMLKLVTRRQNETLRWMLRFWELALAEHMSIPAVLRASERVSAAERRAVELYSALLRKASGVPALWRRYAMFVSDVENDADKAQDCLELVELLEQQQQQGSQTAQHMSQSGSGSYTTARQSTGDGGDNAGTVDGTSVEEDMETMGPEALRQRILESSDSPHRAAIRKLAKFSMIDSLRVRTNLALIVIFAVVWASVIGSAVFSDSSVQSLNLMYNSSALTHSVSAAPFEARAAQRACVAAGGTPSCTAARETLRSLAASLREQRSTVYLAAKTNNQLSAAQRAWAETRVRVTAFDAGPVASAVWTRTDSVFDAIGSLASHVDVLAASDAAAADARSPSLRFVVRNGDPLRVSMRAITSAYKTGFEGHILALQLQQPLFLLATIAACIALGVVAFRPVFARIRDNRAFTMSLFRHIPKRDVAQLVHHLRSIAHEDDDADDGSGLSDDDDDDDLRGDDGDGEVDVAVVNGISGAEKKDEAVEDESGALKEATLQATAKTDRKYMRQTTLSLGNIVIVVTIALIVIEASSAALLSYPNELCTANRLGDVIMSSSALAQELVVDHNLTWPGIDLSTTLGQRVEELRLLQHIMRFGNGTSSGSYGRYAPLDQLLDNDIEPAFSAYCLAASRLITQQSRNATGAVYLSLAHNQAALRKLYGEAGALYVQEMTEGSHALLTSHAIIIAVGSVFIILAHEVLKRITATLRRDADRSCRMLTMIPPETIESVPIIRSFFGGVGAADTPRSKAARFFEKQVSIAQSAKAYSEECRDLCKLARMYVLKSDYAKADDTLSRARGIADRLVRDASTADDRENATALLDRALMQQQQTQAARFRTDAALVTAQSRALLALPTLFGAEHNALPAWARTVVRADDIRRTVGTRNATLVVYSLVEESRWDPLKRRDAPVDALYAWTAVPTHQHSPGKQADGSADAGADTIFFSRTDIARVLGDDEVLEDCLDALFGLNGMGVRIAGALDGRNGADDDDDDDDDDDGDEDDDADRLGSGGGHGGGDAAAADDDDDDAAEREQGGVRLSTGVDPRAARRRTEGVVKRLHRLYDLFIAPQETQLLLEGSSAAPLAGPAQLVVFVPDGEVMHEVPFGALLNSRGDALIERVAVAVTPSVAAFCSRRQDLEAASGGAGAAGAADDDGRGTGGLAVGNPQPVDVPMLLEAMRETQSVRKYCGLPTGDVVNGFSATKPTVLARLGSGPKVIHFAAHACVGDDGQSHVLLAHDEPLTEDDIAAAPLTRTDSVVLSACNTGVGRRSAATGMVRLAWAFLSAGARAVACPLWTVDEVFTRKYVEVLYGSYGRRMRREPSRRRLAVPEAGAASVATASGDVRLAIASHRSLASVLLGGKISAAKRSGDSADDGTGSSQDAAGDAARTRSGAGQRWAAKARLWAAFTVFVGASDHEVSSSLSPSRVSAAVLPMHE